MLAVILAVAVAVALALALARTPTPAPGPDPDVEGDADVEGDGDVAEPTGEEVVVMAAGDIACDPTDNVTSTGECRQQHTSDLVVAANPDAVLNLGDSQYDDGTLDKFLAVYDLTWGRVKDKTYPVPGNHEYRDPAGGARGYFDYFADAAGDPSKGYYTYTLGDWQFYALNTACSAVGGCDLDSPQVRWLRAELAASDKMCAAAYFHSPRWTTGTTHDDDPRVGPIIEALYEYGVELALTAHDHNYQRFPPLNPAGEPDPRGVRQITVGTGGANLYPLDPEDDRAEARSRTFGVLKLRLRADAYDWEFVPDPGSMNETFRDSGTGTCHSAGPSPSGPESPPGELTAPVASNSFEGGSDGGAITASNSGGSSGTAFDAVSVGSGNVLAFSASPARGALAARHDTSTGTGADAFYGWSTAVGTQREIWGRAYLYLADWPSEAFRFVDIRNGTSLAGGINIRGDGRVELKPADADLAGAVSDTPVATGRWVRLEWRFAADPTAGVVEAKLFNDADATVPIETVTEDRYATDTQFTDYRVGIRSAAGIGPFWTDDVEVNRTGYPGPVEQ